jgi:polar amino acid transport system substrate-binding protein
MEDVAANAWDVTLLVVDAARAAKADFSPPYMQTDFTYLVPPRSPVHDIADADRTGLRIAVPQGDASDHWLSNTLKHAELVRVNSISAAIDLVRTERADAYASARPVLLSLAAQLPGSRVLEDGFNTVSYVVLVPKGNPGHLAYISEFTEWAKASGLVKQTIDRAGLRGIKVALL